MAKVDPIRQRQRPPYMPDPRGGYRDPTRYEEGYAYIQNNPGQGLTTHRNAIQSNQQNSGGQTSPQTNAPTNPPAQGTPPKPPPGATNPDGSTPSTNPSVDWQERCETAPTEVLDPWSAHKNAKEKAAKEEADKQKMLDAAQKIANKLTPEQARRLQQEHDAAQQLGLFDDDGPMKTKGWTKKQIDDFLADKPILRAIVNALGGSKLAAIDVDEDGFYNEARTTNPTGTPENQPGKGQPRGSELHQGDRGPLNSEQRSEDTPDPPESPPGLGDDDVLT